MERRQFIAVAVSSGIASTAGCLGILSGDETDSSDDAENTSNGDNGGEDSSAETLLGLYTDADEKRQAAQEDFEQAEEAVSNGNFDEARTKYDNVNQTYNEAEELYKDAQDIATTIGDDEVEEICRDAITYSEMYASASLMAQASASQLEEGDEEEAVETKIEAEEIVEEAEQKPPLTPDELEDVLDGLEE